jgi:hypothetical protein
MGFVRTAARYTLWDHKREEEIMKEIHTLQIIRFIENTGETGKYECR